jgi:hypothetical protein
MITGSCRRSAAGPASHPPPYRSDSDLRRDPQGRDGGGRIEAAWFPDTLNGAGGGGDVRVVAVREYGAAGGLQTVSFATERRVGPATAAPAAPPAQAAAAVE